MSTENSGPYIPPELTEADLEAYDKGGYGNAELAVDPSDLAVLVIDMTREFVDPRFPNGHERGETCAEHIATLLDVTRTLNVPTVYTRYPGYETRAEQGSWGETLDDIDPLPSEAYEIHPSIEPTEDDPLLDKAKPSGFFGTQLESVLNHYGVSSVVITGMTTSGCIRATVIDAFSYNYDVILPRECVADRALVPHRINLFDMGMKYATVADLGTVLERLE